MRDELELAKLIDDTEIAGRLQARAYARIEKYLAPTKWEQVVRRRGVLLRVALGISAAIGAAALLQAAIPDDSSAIAKAFLGLGSGAAIGAIDAAATEWRKFRAIRARADEQVEVVTADLRAARYSDPEAVEEQLASLDERVEQLRRRNAATLEEFRRKSDPQ